MLKVAKLSEEPEQSLIPSSGEKKRIPPFSKPKSPYKVRAILPKKQVTKTQHADATVATADATKSLVASELVEEQRNQPSVAEAEKVIDQNVEKEVKDIGFVAIGEVAEDQSLEIPTDFDSDLQSMPDDDMRYVSRFEAADSDDTYENELIKDSIKSSVSKSIAEELPHVKAQVQKNLQDQLPNILLKPMYKE
uniref:Uncharacterized protein n=1 Tax=Tanacetum cinerariifolium TaxID=118510 RepID=A0A6L2JJW5_TANCI|nr:hypothetical protein [Tanacetum cinerariifolium]